MLEVLVLDEFALEDDFFGFGSLYAEEENILFTIIIYLYFG